MLAWILCAVKANLKTLLIFPKTKNLNWLNHIILKIFSKTRMEQSVESNSSEKFKAIAWLSILFAHISDFFKKKKTSLYLLK